MKTFFGSYDHTARRWLPGHARRRYQVALLVIGLHALLLWILSQTLSHRLVRTQTERERFLVRLIPSQPRAERAESFTTRNLLPTPISVAPLSIEVPTLTIAPIEPGNARAAPVGAAQWLAQQQPAPLRLSLPAGAASQAVRNPARDDRRANTPSLYFGERMASDLGTDNGLREERIDSNGWRIRRGKNCVEVRRTRAAQLDPFNEGIKQTPGLVSKCIR